MAEKPVNISTADKALIDAAGGKTEGLTELTPELLERMRASMSERRADIAARYPALVENCPYETRLAVTAWVFKAICDHAKERGTFRYLIYDRLGFGHDAYMPLYLAGGMEISNEFSLTGPNE